jgi:hypothetical protein
MQNNHEVPIVTGVVLLNKANTMMDTTCTHPLLMQSVPGENLTTTSSMLVFPQETPIKDNTNPPMATSPVEQQQGVIVHHYHVSPYRLGLQFDEVM